MIAFTIQTEISRPIEEVFAFVTNPEELASWQTNTVSARIEGEGPLKLGTRLREIHCGPGGKELASLVEVSEYEPNRLFSLRVIEGSLPIDARIELEPLGQATGLHFSVHGQPRGAVRLLQPLLAMVLKRQFNAHLATLKRVLDGRTERSGRHPAGRSDPSNPR